MRNIFVLVILIILISAIKVSAYDVHFSWSEQAGLTGLRLYYTEGLETQPPFVGEGLGEGPTPVEVPPENTTTTVTNLSQAKAYRFALTAYINSPCPPDSPQAAEYTYPNGDIYCETEYSDIVDLPISPIPTIKAIYLNVNNLNLNSF